MKLHGDLIFERRRGSIALRWDLHSWGVGIHGGIYLSDWRFVGIDECYWVAWIKFTLGPVDLELAYYGPGRKWEEEEWIPLGDLREGAIFEIQGGKQAIKVHGCFPNDFWVGVNYLDNGYPTVYSRDELIRELSEEEWTE